MKYTAKHRVYQKKKKEKIGPMVDRHLKIN